MSRSNTLYLIEEGVSLLESRGVPEARLTAELLLSHVLKQSAFSLYLNPQETMDEEYERCYRELLSLRSQRHPLQYLVREVQFRSSILEVGPGCLIPRPETELLVDVVLRRVGRETEAVKILDVGTGSGNIGISLLVERNKWRVIGTDCMKDACDYASRNAVRNGVSNRFRAVHTDFWKGLEGEVFDGLISNPPYLTVGEVASLQPEVSYEPAVALDGGEDGLVFFRAIACNAKKMIHAGGFIFFEVGAGQAKTVADLLEANVFSSVEVETDDSGIERMVSGCLNHG